MNPLSGWLNSRTVRRFTLLDDRRLIAGQLWRTGRFTEFAEEMAELAVGYAREDRLAERDRAVAEVLAWRCAALVRAGLPAQAEAEATRLAERFPDGFDAAGRYRRELESLMDAAYRGVEPEVGWP